MVGNIDYHATKYAASVRLQRSRNEGIEAMEEMVRERISAFLQANKALPAHIVLFRDGVSESQFDTVLEQELPRLRAACRKIQCKEEGKVYDPTVTLVVVQKRHSTRFYVPAEFQGMAGVNKGNVPAGTVVDRYIVSDLDHTGEKENHEFYLCSHKGMLGTSRPAHYYMLADDWGLTADDIQGCAYALCHLFARAPMAVSIPAPVYYAHLACYRARKHYLCSAGDGNTPPAGAGQQADVDHAPVIVAEPLKLRMYFC